MVALWLVTAGVLVHRAMQGDDETSAVDVAMLVDVNHANLATLQLLPGVGPRLARRIITQRAIKPFGRPRDLIRISGIGAVVMQRIAPMVACR